MKKKNLPFMNRGVSMKFSSFVCVFSTFFFVSPCFSQDRSAQFCQAVAAKIGAGHAVRGDDPEWYFPTRELKHLAIGSFWEKPWDTVAENHSDPVEGIVEFHKMLQEKGVGLLLVPIPAKGAIYPDYLVNGSRPGDATALAPFLDQIREAGVEVLDLEPVLLKARKADAGTLLYCRQDAHFSPATAMRVGKMVASAKPMEGGTKGKFTLGSREMLTFVGDLVSGGEKAGVIPPESLPVNYVFTEGKVGVAADPSSPILLLGDSHTLVFHEGRESGMHCVGAGVADSLAAAYGFAPDLVGVRGSGMVQARKQLFYKASSTPGYWDGKKLVVWMFSAREFTQSTDKPVTIPLTR